MGQEAVDLDVSPQRDGNLQRNILGGRPFSPYKPGAYSSGLLKPCGLSPSNISCLLFCLSSLSSLQAETGKEG